MTNILGFIKIEKRNGGTLITKDEFINILSYKNKFLLKQTHGITHDDSLVQPQTGGNCLNWVIGHLLVNLVEVFEVLGGETPPELPELDLYSNGSNGICGDSSKVIPLQVLVKHYTHLTKLVSRQLRQMKDADFDEGSVFWQDKSRRGYMAFFYFFHNTHYLGKLVQLRSMIGKKEKVF